MIGEYSQKDIFNTDETGLFFKSMPYKTLNQARNTSVKKSKKRISVLFTCSITGIMITNISNLAYKQLFSADLEEAYMWVLLYYLEPIFNKFDSDTFQQLIACPGLGYLKRTNKTIK